jgi:ABC-type polysaccharide/polyol phosphate transport system ATPase subunit
MSALLEASSLGKRYVIRQERSVALSLMRRNPAREHWALRGLDAHVDRGEIVGVIGRNGAGKSTLLKLAAGVTRQTEGTLRRPERIAPLIEVGAGFHPELSGRENVDVNARLLGISPREIHRAFDDIVDFAEMRHAIDQPVRQYSSGMFMRLGFAVAIHTRPDLLIVDEVLAVGDLPFQVRCLDRIRELKNQGVGVLFVSHNLTAVQSLADRALLLERGRVIAEGDTREVIGAYHQTMHEGLQLAQVGEDGTDGHLLEIESLTVTDEDGRTPSLWSPGQRAFVRMRLRAVADCLSESSLGVRMVKEGEGMVGKYAADHGPYLPAMKEGDAVDVTVAVSLNFAGGGYLLDVAIAHLDYRTFLLRANGVCRFGIGSRPGGAGIVDIDPAVTVEPE